MRHTFEKLFDKAVRQSTEDENQVCDVAEDLRSRGYNPCEIAEVLKRLEKKLVDASEAALVHEAYELMEGWCRPGEE